MIAATESSALLARISPLFPQGAASLPLIEATTARALGLQDGQVVQALVQARGDQLALLLKGRLFDLPPGLNWAIGQTLALRVQAQTPSHWALHLQQESTELTPSTSFSRLGSLMFRTPGLPHLMQLFQPGVLDRLLAPLERPDLQAQWRSMRLTMAQLSGAQVGQAVLAALGSEVQIANGRSPLKADPKQLLHQMLSALRQNAGANLEDSSAVQALQRGFDDIESAQVHSAQMGMTATPLGQSMQPNLAFTMVLPFSDANPVELTFERQRSDHSDSDLLSVNVHSHSEEYGELWLKTELRGTNAVNLVMWATQTAVAELARSQAQALQEQLQCAGLVLQSFQVISGPRPEAGAPPLPEWVSTKTGVVLDLQA